MKIPRMSIEEKFKLLDLQECGKHSISTTQPFSNFLLDCKLFLSPSAYGKRIEKRWIEDHRYKKINEKTGIGDYTHSSKVVEFKTSYMSDSNKRGKLVWRILQIRTHQKIDRYDLLLIQREKKGFKYFEVRIPAKVMHTLACDYGSATHNGNFDTGYSLTITKAMLEDKLKIYIHSSSTASL